MRQFAQAASLSRDTTQVVISWIDELSHLTIWTMPTINIPAENLDHAFRIAEAINSGLVASK